MRASCITRSVTSCQRQQPIYIYLSAPDTRDAAFQMKFQLCHQICWHSPYAVNTSRPTSTKFASRVNCTLFIAVKMLPSAGVSQSLVSTENTRTRTSQIWISACEIRGVINAYVREVYKQDVITDISFKKNLFQLLLISCQCQFVLGV